MRGSYLLGITLVACAQSTTSTQTSTSAAATAVSSERRNPDVITATEIATQPGATNALELVQRLRPNFLRVNERSSMRNTSSSPIVRLDNAELGEVSELRSIAASGIFEIRYFSIVAAESRFGGNRGRPVIFVATKK